MFMGFILHIYTIFGTNLLTGGPARIAVFFLFQYFEEKEYQTESKRNETFGNVIFSPNVIQETWTLLQGVKEEVTRVGGAPPRARPPASWAPCGSPNRFPSPIYIYVPQKLPRAPRKPNSAAATFCICEIPSWSLRRHSAGGGINHGGPLHQHPCPSDEL